MHKSLSRFLSLAILAGFILHGASAQAQAASNIAVVNIQGIMRDSTAAKSIRDQMEAKQKAYQSDLQKKEESLQKEDAELRKQKSVLSKEALEEKAKAFNSKATDLQKEVAGKKAALDGAFERSLNEIQKSVTDIIAEMAKEKGFSIAIPTSQILYADTSMDISADVLKRLNERLPRVDVKFDAPAAPKDSKKK